MKKWRLILSGYNDHSFNMAVDEAILYAFRNGRVRPTLRVYGWSQPAVSLGYFQSSTEVLNSSDQIPYVRRMTGGQAIYHHPDEITYSLVCRNYDLDLPRSIKESYKSLCRFLLNTYADFGLKAQFFCDRPEFFTGNASHYCFSDRQDFDICVCGKKLGGNAQKRTRDLIFQHGSIPLDLDREMIKNIFGDQIKREGTVFTALNELLGEKISPRRVQEVLVEAFRRTFGVELLSEELSDFERELALRLEQEKYGDPAWNETRGFAEIF